MRNTEIFGSLIGIVCGTILGAHKGKQYEIGGFSGVYNGMIPLAITSATIFGLIGIKIGSEIDRQYERNTLLNLLIP